MFSCFGLLLSFAQFFFIDCANNMVSGSDIDDTAMMCLREGELSQRMTEFASDIDLVYSDDDTPSSTESLGSMESDTASSFSSESFSDESTDDSDPGDFMQKNSNTCNLSEQEQQALRILSIFLKHNLSASASKYIIELMKSMFPGSKALDGLTYENIWKICGDEASFQEIHYCDECNRVFPDDISQFKCSSTGCNGLRFHGPESKQPFSKLPRKSFILANVGKQLGSLIKAAGVYDSVIFQFTTTEQVDLTKIVKLRTKFTIIKIYLMYSLIVCVYIYRQLQKGL